MPTELARDERGRLLIDVRGPRFGAAITTVVLAVALVVQGPVGVGLVAWQWLVFAVAALAGLAWSPYGTLFRWAKRRFDLGPPPATETEGPPRFAQACGLAVSTVALVAFALGAASVGWVAVGTVLALSTLLATTGLCVGCELYLVGRRLAAGGVGARRGERRGRGADAVFGPDHLDAVGLDLAGASAGAVLLGSPTCTSCASVKQVLAELEQERSGFRWVHVDAGEHLELATSLRVLRVPTLFLVDRDGRVLVRESGVPRLDTLQSVLDGTRPTAPTR